LTTLFQKRRRRRSQRFSKPLQEHNRWVARATLDVADVVTVDAGFIGERFLAPPPGGAQAAKVHTEALTDVHGSPETRLSTMDLQTISDIGVDFRRRQSGRQFHLSPTGGHHGSDRGRLACAAPRQGIRADHRALRQARPGWGMERRGVYCVILPFGFDEIDHTLCRAGDWDAVKARFAATGRTASGASQGARELHDVYTLGADCLWVTMADGRLYWGFADPEVIPVNASGNGEYTRYRRVIGGWSRTSLTGEPLTTRSLSSALLRTASYRMTICKVAHGTYLLRRIRDEADPLHAAAVALQAQQEALAVQMIAQLDWRDFETLVDLILTRSGWRRRSNVGDGEVDIDLLLDNPSTGETAWVEVKSTTSQKALDDYLARFERDGSAERFFFVCHSPNGTSVERHRPRHRRRPRRAVRLADRAHMLLIPTKSPPDSGMIALPDSGMMSPLFRGLRWLVSCVVVNVVFVKPAATVSFAACCRL